MQGLANCYVAQEETEKAIKTSTGLLVIDPMNYTANRRLADLHFQKQAYGSAESYYLKLAILYPEDLTVASQLGWCYFHLKRVEQARVVFASILIAAPDHASSLSGLRVRRAPNVQREGLT